MCANGSETCASLKTSANLQARKNFSLRLGSVQFAACPGGPSSLQVARGAKDTCCMYKNTAKLPNELNRLSDELASPATSASTCSTSSTCSANAESRGFALDLDSQNAGISCVAIAITSRSAVAVAGPTSRLPEFRLITIAQQIRQELDKVRPVGQGWL